MLEKKLCSEALPEMSLFGFSSGAPGGDLIAIRKCLQRRKY